MNMYQLVSQAYSNSPPKSLDSTDIRDLVEYQFMMYKTFPHECHKILISMLTMLHYETQPFFNPLFKKDKEYN